MQCESVLLHAKCFINPIHVTEYATSQSIELQGINYLAVLPRACKKGIFAPSCKTALCNRTVGDGK